MSIDNCLQFIKCFSVLLSGSQKSNEASAENNIYPKFRKISF